MTPGESLALWVLLLEREQYESNIKKVTKEILQTTEPFTKILYNRLPKTFMLLFLIRKKEQSLRFGKKIKNKLKTNPGFLSRRTVSFYIRTQPGCHLF